MHLMCRADQLNQARWSLVPSRSNSLGYVDYQARCKFRVFKLKIFDLAYGTRVQGIAGWVGHDSATVVCVVEAVMHMPM